MAEYLSSEEWVFVMVVAKLLLDVEEGIGGGSVVLVVIGELSMEGDEEEHSPASIVASRLPRIVNFKDERQLNLKGKSAWLMEEGMLCQPSGNPGLPEKGGVAEMMENLEGLTIEPIVTGLRMAERPFFDSKPIILKMWSPEYDMDIEQILTVPVWIHVHAHFKYWGQRCLEKLTKSVGKFVKVDHTTANRDRLAYARCTVEVKVAQDFPNQVFFLDEKDQKRAVHISYEWRPMQCINCKQMGHDDGQCYKQKVTQKKTWKPKPKGN
ncbi:Beta-mannosyltransferase 2 [Bienertia sinuspersici]